MPLIEMANLPFEIGVTTFILQTKKKKKKPGDSEKLSHLAQNYPPKERKKPVQACDSKDPNLHTAQYCPLPVELSSSGSQ